MRVPPPRSGRGVAHHPSGRAAAREEIFLRRAQLAAELAAMGLPPVVDYAHAGAWRCRAGALPDRNACIDV
eukprot:354329-Chlamydomonas_euryale.AAC.2